MKRLSCVIPCYGSQNTISEVVKDIVDTLSIKNMKEYEIILVNDGSPDEVWKEIKKLTQMYNEVKGINLVKNFGQHSALMAGYNYATGEYILTLDDDGQTPSEEIFKLIEKIEKGYDVVYGEYEDRQDSGFRKFGTLINNYMLEVIIGKPKDIHLTSYFLAKNYIIDEICKYRNPYPYIWGLIIRTTNNITNVTIKHKKRETGKSGYTLMKLLNLWLNGFTAFSVKPLRIATGFGIFTSIIGFFFVIYTVLHKVLNPNIAAGYSSLMSALLVIGGIIMLLLGMIGEYLGRIYICINNSPQYVIKEIIDEERNNY